MGSIECLGALRLDQQQDDFRMDALNALLNRGNDRLHVGGGERFPKVDTDRRDDSASSILSMYGPMPLAHGRSR